jgi:hypothetical protein
MRGVEAMSDTDYGNAAHESAEELLNRAVQKLQQESASIQIQGRALTDEEQARIKQIEAAGKLINQALDELAASE